MELEQLRQIEAIARTGTMSAAARELHLSQPALSRSVQRLEADLRMPLFDRAGRRVALNEAGACVAEWARRILNDERLMRDELDGIAQRRRALRVATVAPAPLWRLTSRLVERFPEETITSRTVEGVAASEMVLSDEVDLAIVREPPEDPRLRSCEFMRERLFAVLPPSHPLSSRGELHLSDLDGDTFLILSDIGFWRGLVDAAMPKSEFIEIGDREVFAQLSRTTPHCTFATDAPFLEGARIGRAVVPIADEDATAVFYLAVRKDSEGLPSRLFDWVSHKGC